MEEFITVVDTLKSELVQKKSKFITNIFYVDNVIKSENIIKNIKKSYFDARHNCIAYRIINNEQIVEKSSDDGEPSGTAGGPMLNILKKNNLCNVLVIVTRYFGGILLGTGGLVRAYSESVLNIIQKCKKIKMCLGIAIEVTIDYNYFENFKHYCRNNSINIVHSQYSEFIVCKIELEDKLKHKIIKDYETKKIILKDLKIISKKYIEKSIIN